ncbi:MerR family transcriptional regulator [Neobacillus ginsengisoli]|uniref:DNA-binding transcriptional MerR regulator n=1 Tax=Neobacillus ginsengisoli TaxID=904295 RepID=A0ABT9Y011_9BACI|nr:MerR family transcriptional regulator [Neobacillus ginsengisoli]MDQ0201169.1 DNA-binding transcriptional MerR regulator [Neobacillus ginsengisoli]
MTVIYSPSDVQNLLGIDSSTLRKYATLLERHGYHVHRNNRGHRGYYDKDLITLRKLIEFSKQEDMTMERSVEAVMTWYSEEENTVTVTEVLPVQTTNNRDFEQDTIHDKLLERIEHLEQINLDLINHLKEKAVREAKQEEMMNQILKYVERMEQLERCKMIEIETRNQTAAATQKKWWKWWK